MYYHIPKEIFIKKEVSVPVFKAALNKKWIDIELPFDEEWKDIAFRDNKFIRLTEAGSYVDLQIKNISIGEKIIVHAGDVIDYGIERVHTYINKITEEECTARTIHEAASIFKINIRHIKRIKS